MANRILIIACDPLFLESLGGLLGKRYELATADSDDEALAQVERVVPDLVLLQPSLPQIDGQRTCSRLKSDARTRRIQVIVVPQESSDREYVRALEAGADDCLMRPLSPKALLSRVRLHLRLQAAIDGLQAVKAPSGGYASELERLVAERTRTIVGAQGVSLVTLTALAQARETGAEDRLLRMRYYACVLADELARERPHARLIDVVFIDRLYHAVPLHDIGKIVISDSVLQKQRPLTPEERRIMKEHTTVGAILLEQLVSRDDVQNTFLAMAATIARWHHEKFDGTGYPKGLAGDKIPLPARIVSLADVYEALTTNRPMRSTESPQSAKAIIEEQSSKHFDPAVVSAFQRCFQDIAAVQQRFDKGFPTVPGAISFLE